MTRTVKQGFHVVLTSESPIRREDYDKFLHDHRGKSIATLLGEGELRAIHEGNDVGLWFRAGKHEE